MIDNIEDDQTFIKNVKSQYGNKWILIRDLTEFLSGKVYRSYLRRELLTYSIFIIAVMIFLFVDNNVDNRYHFEQVMQQRLLKTEVAATDWQASFLDPFPVSFTGIDSSEEFWLWVKVVLLPSLYPQTKYNGAPLSSGEKGYVFGENRLLWGVRFRQQRVRSDSCSIPFSFDKFDKSCYGMYSASGRSEESFGPNKEYVFSSSSKTGSLAYTGTFGTYGGEGFVVDMPVLNSTMAYSTVDKLISDLWIDRATRSVFITFTVYNANVNLFLHAKFILEFGPSGSVEPSYSFFSFQVTDTSSLSSGQRLLYLMPLLFLGIVTVWFTLKVFNDMRKGYSSGFWLPFDLFLYSIALYVVILGFIRIISGFVRDGEMKGGLPKLDSTSFFSTETIVDEIDTENGAGSLLLLLCLIRTIKYSPALGRVAAFNKTMMMAAADFVPFTVVFGIVFLGFSLMGYVLFGSSLSNYRTVVDSASTMLRCLLGSYDYESISEVHPNLAPVFFFSYVLIMYMILLSIFIGIFVHAYGRARNQLSKKEQMGDVDKLFLSGFNQIKEALKGVIKRFQLRRAHRALKKNYDFMKLSRILRLVSEWKVKNSNRLFLGYDDIMEITARQIPPQQIVFLMSSCEVYTAEQADRLKKEIQADGGQANDDTLKALRYKSLQEALIHVAGKQERMVEGLQSKLDSLEKIQTAQVVRVNKLQDKVDKIMMRFQ
eukprot:GILI01008520.1.p1 GENE.GILI01008520.1~~GILI01008520.1.p1  ORF type:complete len:710 (+),score=131.76 GILI01008520.1:112-2241(+)